MTLRQIHLPGGTGGDSGSDAIWSDDLRIKDAIKNVTLLEPEQIGLRDLLGNVVTIANERVRALDQFRVAGGTVAPATRTRLTSKARLTVSGLTFPRSATPDSDRMGDSFTHGGATGTNHGAATSLQVTHDILSASGRRYAHMFFDLRWLQGWAGRTDLSSSLSIHVSQTALGTATMDWGMEPATTKPFNESTITWSNQPPTPTAATGQIAGISSAGGTYLITIPKNILDAALGGWLRIAFTTTAGLTTINITSRESGGNRPALNLELQAA